MKEIFTLEDTVSARVEQIVNQKKLNAEPLKKDENEFPKHLVDSSWDEGFNTFGFSALPAGLYYRDRNDEKMKFKSLGESAWFWASTEDDGAAEYLYLNSARVGGGGFDKIAGDGLSVRCLKD